MHCDTSRRLWNRTAQTLGKWLTRVVSLPDRTQPPAHSSDRYERDEAYPRFPSF